MKKEILEWIIAIAVALIIVGLVQKFLFTSYTVSGESMHPTFEDRDRVMAVSYTHLTLPTNREV